MTQYMETEPNPSPNTSALFKPANLGDFSASLELGLNLLHQALATVDQPFSGTTPEALRQRFTGLDLDRPLQGGTPAALKELQALYLQDTVYYHHPHYVAHLNCPVFIASLLADLISSALNTAVETWDQSAGATLIEEQVIDWTARRIGLGQRADGVFTTGGSQSNLMGLLLARSEHTCDKEDLRTITEAQTTQYPYRILCSEFSHFSVSKAAHLLGLGKEAAIPVACDQERQMCPQALQERLEDLKREHLRPLAVVATAGTTDFGSLDPLEPIADICSENELWLHVDAAYGGGLLVSEKHRDRLTGIERADSVAVDFHKSFFQPLCCSAFLVRECRHLRHLTHHADYLNPAEHEAESIPNLVNKSIQTSRRFDALKMWLTLRIVGADRIGSMLEQIIDTTRALAAELHRDPETEIAHKPALTTLVFRFHHPCMGNDVQDACNRAIRERLAQNGEALVAGTVCNRRYHLKFTLLDPDTKLETLLDIHRRIKKHGNDIVREFMKKEEYTA